MTSNTHAILTDAEVMEMLGAFYSEALRFLGVPQDQWAKIGVGVFFVGAEGKASIIGINYAQRTILVNLPMLKMIIQFNPKAAGDTPSVYRFYGYKLARFWQQYVKTGECRIFEQDKDSNDFAMALGIVKGLPQIDLPVSADYPCFVVNQLSQRDGHAEEMPRYSIKPSLANNKILYRGQSQFFKKCVPNLFRDEKKVKDCQLEEKANQFVDDVIQIKAISICLRRCSVPIGTNV